MRRKAELAPSPRRRSPPGPFLPVLAALAILTPPLALASPPPGLPSPEAAEARVASQYAYYVATIAAAAANLRLHDTAAARQWLDAAPAELRGWEWSHLDVEADGSAASFVAQPAAITDLAVSPDGVVLAVSGGTEVGLWDTGSGVRVASLRGHDRSVWNARFSADGKALATVASDGSLRIWSRAGATETLAVEGVGSGVGGVAWHPDGGQVATVSWRREADGEVVGVVDLWDAATGERIHHLDHGVKPVVSVNYAADGSRLFVGTWDFDVTVYDSATWAPLLRLLPPDDGIYKAVRESRPSPDGRLLAVAHDDGVVRIWDAATGALRHQLQRQAEGARLAQNDVAWFPDGKRIAAASSDLTVRIWDTEGRHLAALHGHTTRVTAVALSPDGRTLYSGDASGQVRIWPLGELEPDRWRWPLPDVGYGVAVSHDGRRVAATGWTGWAVIVDLESGDEVVRWSAHETSGVRVAWSADDGLLATTGNDGKVKVWNARETPPVLLFERAVEIQSSAVAFSSDGRLLASPAAGPALRVWSVADGGEVAALGEEVVFDDAEWHPHRPLVAVGGRDGVVRLWEPGSGVVEQRLAGHGDGPLRVTFSSDGRRLAAVSSSGVIRLWDLATASVVHEMKVASGGPGVVAFSPDGRRLATGGADNSVHLWDPATGAHLLRAPFSEAPYDIAWSRDGRRLLVIPLDGTIRVLRSSRRPLGAGEPVRWSPGSPAG